MAHSTGGLITSLYLADTKNQDSIRAFILNSPFFDFNFSKAEEKIVLPLLSASAGIAPSKVISGVSKSPELYAQSLLLPISRAMGLRHASQERTTDTPSASVGSVLFVVGISACSVASNSRCLSS